MGQPLVFPHGVTVYDPEKCWNGYTLVPLINDGVLLFDMNGNEVRRWNMHAMPPKLLPGGYVMAVSYTHLPRCGARVRLFWAGADSPPKTAAPTARTPIR